MISRLIELVSFALSQAFDENESDWLDIRSELAGELEDRGFEPEEIEIALDVAGRIRETLDREPLSPDVLKTNQIYKFLEEWKLTPEARGYLLDLQRNNFLTHEQHQTVIERCLAVDDPEPVDLDLVRKLVNWVASGEEDDFSLYMSHTLH